MQPCIAKMEEKKLTHACFIHRLKIKFVQIETPGLSSVPTRGICRVVEYSFRSSATSFTSSLLPSSPPPLPPPAVIRKGCQGSSQNVSPRSDFKRFTSSSPRCESLMTSNKPLVLFCHHFRQPQQAPQLGWFFSFKNIPSPGAAQRRFGEAQCRERLGWRCEP